MSAGRRSGGASTGRPMGAPEETTTRGYARSTIRGRLERPQVWRTRHDERQARSARFTAVSVWETILYFVVPIVGLYLIIVLLVVAPRMARRPRYRVGQPWPHQPLWWTANPAGAQLPAVDGHAVTGERGGARGSW
jgi:hypothetical protein